MTNTIRYKGLNTNRLHSPKFWRPELIHAIQRGEKDGFYHFNDFQGDGAALATTAVAWRGGSPALPYLGFATASSTMKSGRVAADDEIGVLVCDNDADDDEAYLGFDNTYCEPFGKISNVAGDNKPIWFEARVRFTNIASATATVAKIIGLRAAVDAATVDIPNGGATIKVEEFVGFRALSGDGDGMDAVYCDDAEVVYAEAASYSNLVIVADTWYKFGLHYDGTYVHYYVNGNEIGTGVLPSATNFPNAEPLMPYFGSRLDGTDTANHCDIDWWAFMRSDELRV